MDIFFVISKSYRCRLLDNSMTKDNYRNSNSNNNSNNNNNSNSNRNRKSYCNSVLNSPYL